MAYIGIRPAGISSASQVETDQLTVDNVKIDGNTISSTDTNGDITLDPNGTGDTIIASGNLGIGTTSPTVSNGKGLVIADATAARLKLCDTTTGEGSSDGVQLGHSGGIGFLFNHENEALQFGTNSTERMRLTGSSGEVLIGTTSSGSSTRLNLTGDAGGSSGICSIKNDSANGGTMQTSIHFRNSSNGTVGTIKVNNSETAYNSASDYRLKENVADMTGAIDRVKTLAPKRFNFIANADTTVDGFLAHEAQAVVPEAVTGTHNEVDADGNAVMQQIDQSKLVPLLCAALKESIAKIEALETENSTQATQIADLITRVTALENA